ncbi:MAG: alpha/beta hydrolase [Chloroflexi bacterium]|nr:MAG: alpha/beta hydrolase [Chloroflexota bacterium]
MADRAAGQERALEPSDAFIDLPGRGDHGASLRLHYRDWGGNGQAILLLHGLSSSCRIWDFAAPQLATRFRVLALDQRGHGLSDVPESYSFPEVTGDVAEFARLLGVDRAVIAGHSWGAGVALQFAVDYAEMASAIVLVDGGMNEMSARMSWERAEQVMMPPRIDGVPLQTFLGFARQWPHVRDIWSPQLQESILSNFEIRDERVYRRLPIEKHMRVARAIFDQRVGELYPMIACPVLLVPALKEPSSDQEKAWQDARREGMAVALRLLPKVSVEPMEDTAHDVPILRPRELADAIARFVESAV